MRYRVSNGKMRFIENGFPAAKLHMIAMREGNSKRPIYQIHKWWARRLGSVFRTLLISSFSPAHESEKDLWAKYYNGFSLQGKIIYDPLMGGGTSLIEALRLGCNVIGSDINPVAWFVTKKEIETFDEELADHYFKKLEENVGKSVKKFYKTRCNNNHLCNTLYAIWARQVQCPKCRKESDLFTSRIIRDDETSRVLHCPSCDEIFSTKQKSNKVKCLLCHHSFDPNARNAERGCFTCSCKTRTKIIELVKIKKQPLESRIICIQFECDKCGRGYKVPTKNDINKFKLAEKLLIKNKKLLPIPKQKVHRGHMADARPGNHGFKYYNQLFNPRQLYSLALTLKEIKKIPDQNVKEFLLLTFSSCLETNNLLCKYETNWGKISALFVFPSYHVPERYGENNLWGNGRGSFVRSYLKLKRGKTYAHRSYEILQKANGITSKKKKKFTGYSILTNIGSSKSTSQKDRVRLLCRNSKKMPMIKTGAVDAIVTDPPYFDVMSYSRLADFFYVWLRLELQNNYPWFKDDSSEARNEMVLNDYSEKGTARFVSQLTGVFKECKRVLKSEGILVFTFHHSKEWAWSNLKEALNASGFTATASHVIRSEGKTGFQKNGDTGYDVCVVAKKTRIVKQKKKQVSKLVENYSKNIKSMRQYNPSIKTSDMFTAVMGQYMLSNETDAKEFLEIHSKFAKTAKIRN